MCAASFTSYVMRIVPTYIHKNHVCKVIKCEVNKVEEIIYAEEDVLATFQEIRRLFFFNLVMDEIYLICFLGYILMLHIHCASIRLFACFYFKSKVFSITCRLIFISLLIKMVLNIRYFQNVCILMQKGDCLCVGGT